MTQNVATHHATPEIPDQASLLQDTLGQRGARRRAALSRLGLSAAGTTLMAALAAGGVATTSTPAEATTTYTDADILNFALNLEYLEAEFYLRATTGQGLQWGTVTGTGTQGQVTGGSKVPFTSSAIKQYAEVLAYDEYQHVLVLRSALGGNAVAEPAINLSTSFTTLAVAAGLIKSGETFDPFADDLSFLLGAYVFEDVGVTAYAGAAPLIQNHTYLGTAAAILGTEAYHGGAIRSLLGSFGAGAPTDKISALRASLSNAQDDEGVLLPNDPYNFVTNDSNGLVFHRTPQQVLNIVYGGGAASNYLFFPDKVNGTIR